MRANRSAASPEASARSQAARASATVAKSPPMTSSSAERAIVTSCWRGSRPSGPPSPTR